jgi:hypothetical protein
MKCLAGIRRAWIKIEKECLVEEANLMQIIFTYFYRLTDLEHSQLPCATCITTICHCL